MINKIIILLFLIVLNSFPSKGQFNAPNTLKYPFIKSQENNLIIYGDKAWSQFFNKLDNQYLEGEEKINILHFGGSHIQADIWSNRMRTNFQHSSPYNNSARGFIFPFKLIKSNGSPFIKTSYSGRWKGYRSPVRQHNGPFGLMGVRAELLDSISTIKIWNKNPSNKYDAFNSVDVFFKDSSNDYEIKVIVDSNIQINHIRDKEYIKFQLSRSVHSIIIQISKKHTTESKFFFSGLQLNNDNYGISYHSIGVNGASVNSYLRCIDLENQLKLIKPDLVIFSIGINDAYEEDFSQDLFYKNYDTLINKIKSVNPNTAILLTTNNDSYYKRKYPNKRAFEVRDKMFELAKNKDLAVWDMFQVMGGLNSIKEWQKYKLAKKDLIHLTFNGYNLIGDLLFEAFMKSYIIYNKDNG
jgi:lysophospholipase L1-like esterase